MCEIIALIGMCQGMGKLLRGKGRNPLLFQIMLVISWFVGEIGGAIVGGIVTAMQGGGDDGFNLLIYVFALGGAACGAGFWFLIASVLPPVAVETPTYGAGGMPPPYPSRQDPNNPYSR